MKLRRELSTTSASLTIPIMQFNKNNEAGLI